MSQFKQEPVTVRGVEYVVREWSNRIRREFVRRAQNDEADTVNALLAFSCVLRGGKPAFESEEAADEMPPEVVDELAKKVLEVSGRKVEDDSKND